MHKEIIRSKVFTSVEVMTGVFIIVVSLFCINLFAHMVELRTSYVDIATILITLTGVVFLCYKSLIQYKYRLIGNELVIQRVRAGKENTSIHLNLNQIVKFELVNSSAYEKDMDSTFYKKMNCRTCKWEKSGYYVIYMEDGELNLFLFQPSKKLVELIEKRLKLKEDSQIA